MHFKLTPLHVSRSCDLQIHNIYSFPLLYQTSGMGSLALATAQVSELLLGVAY